MKDSNILYKRIICNSSSDSLTYSKRLKHYCDILNASEAVKLYYTEATNSSCNPRSNSLFKAVN